MEEKRTCYTCPKHDTCKKLCSDMDSRLLNKKRGKNSNDTYADNTETHKARFTAENLNKIIYMYGMSESASRAANRIIIALLTPEQKEVLELYANGYSQVEIAEKLCITQSCVSQRIKSIRKSLKENFVHIVDCIT